MITFSGLGHRPLVYFSHICCVRESTELLGFCQKTYCTSGSRADGCLHLVPSGHCHHTSRFLFGGLGVLRGLERNWLAVLAEETVQLYQGALWNLFLDAQGWPDPWRLESNYSPVSIGEAQFPSELVQKSWCGAVFGWVFHWKNSCSVSEDDQYKHCSWFPGQDLSLVTGGSETPPWRWNSQPRAWKPGSISCTKYITLSHLLNPGLRLGGWHREQERERERWRERREPLRRLLRRPTCLSLVSLHSGELGICGNLSIFPPGPSLGAYGSFFPRLTAPETGPFLEPEGEGAIDRGGI